MESGGGRNKRDMWVKIDEEGKSMGLAHLGVIADLVSGSFSVASIPWSFLFTSRRRYGNWAK